MIIRFLFSPVTILCCWKWGAQLVRYLSEIFIFWYILLSGNYNNKQVNNQTAVCVRALYGPYNNARQIGRMRERQTFFSFFTFTYIKTLSRVWCRIFRSIYLFLQFSSWSKHVQILSAWCDGEDKIFIR